MEESSLFRPACSHQGSTQYIERGGAPTPTVLPSKFTASFPLSSRHTERPTLLFLVVVGLLSIVLLKGLFGLRDSKMLEWS